MTDTVKEKRKSTKKAKAEETEVSTASEDLFQAQASATDEVQKQDGLKQEEVSSEHVPERVCDMMRRIRLEKRLDLNDASAYLCIRAQFLRAIEEGNLKELPGETYASGFIRSYASFLGLDPNKTDRLYREEMLAGTREKNRPVSGAEIKKAAPDNKIIIASLVSLIVLSVVWKFYSNSVQEVPVTQTPAQETAFEPENPYPFDNAATPEAYASFQKKDIPPVPPKKPAIPEEKPVEDNVVTQQKDVLKPVAQPSVREDKSETVDSDRQEDVEEQSENVVSSENAPATQTTEPKIQKPYVPKIFGIKNVDARIVLRAKEETWIEVTRGEEVLLTRTLYAGDRYRVPVDSKDLYLKTGNAGGLDVLVDGTLVPALGKRGTTKSKIALDADSFLAGSPEEN